MRKLTSYYLMILFLVGMAITSFRKMPSYDQAMEHHSHAIEIYQQEQQNLLQTINELQLETNALRNSLDSIASPQYAYWASELCQHQRILDLWERIVADHGAQNEFAPLQITQPFNRTQTEIQIDKAYSEIIYTYRNLHDLGEQLDRVVRNIQSNQQVIEKYIGV